MDLEISEVRTHCENTITSSIKEITNKTWSGVGVHACNPSKRGGGGGDPPPLRYEDIPANLSYIVTLRQAWSILQDPVSKGHTKS